MYEFRQVKPETFEGYINTAEPILQVMQTHKLIKLWYGHGMAKDSVQEVAIPIDNPQWKNVEVIFSDEEYEKAKAANDHQFTKEVRK